MIPKWWKFMIMFSAFTIQVITFGIGGAIGLYSIEFIEYFKVSAAEVSIVGAVNLGVFLGAGPVASYLMRRMSYRKVAVIGSLLSTIGLLVMPFLNNIILLYAVYGVLVGLGFAMAYLPSSVLAGLYFEKHRSLASGVVTSGSGLGQTVFQMLCHVLIQHYGWKGSLFILAGSMLQCLVCATLLFPLPPKASKEEAALILNENCHIKQVLNGRNATDVNSEQSEIELKKDSNGICLTEISETYQPNGCSSEAAIMLQENNPKIDSNHSSTTSTQQCNILSDFNFQVFFWNNLLWNMGIAISWVLAPEYIVKMGLTKANAATIMTLGGFGCFIGCIIGGGLGNIQRFSRLYMYIMWNLGTGVSIMLMTVKVFQTVAALSCIMFVNGIAFGGVLGLLVIFTVDLLGEKVLGDAFGYLMLSNGLGSIIGPPLGGLWKDTLGTYDPTFYFAGVLILFGGVFMFLIPIRRQFTSEPGPTRTIELTVAMNTESNTI